LTALYIAFSISGRKFPDDLNIDFEEIVVCSQLLFQYYGSLNPKNKATNGQAIENP
jgi:hypothetical protein